jgi:DNA-binding NarL/FixJ family response regulator
MPHPSAPTHTISEALLAQLPGVLAQVAQAAGVKAAVQLAQARGGGRAYIPAPQALHEKHWLTQAVGLEAARAIAQALGGGEVEVPLGPFAGNRAQVWAAIERGLNAGLSVEQAARQVGVTARTVRRHKSGAGGMTTGQELPLLVFIKTSATE